MKVIIDENVQIVFTRAGNPADGELEIGQVSANIHDLKSAVEVVEEIWGDFNVSRQKILASTQ